MSFTSKFRDWTDSIKNIIIIVGVVGIAAFVILTVAGDFTENDGPPKLPGNAVYSFTIENTGKSMLTESYSQITPTSWRLDGYWELVKNKWKYRDVILPLDEKYFGKIKVERVENE